MRFIPAVSLAFVAGLVAQDRDATQHAIREQAFMHSEVIDNLRFLCDRIGPRLTGSPQLQLASEWACEKFEGYGLSCRLEPFEIAHRWSRVRAVAKIVEPVERVITVAAGGWTPSTHGTVRAEVVDLTAPRESESEGGEEHSRNAGRAVLTRRIPWNRRGVGADPFRGAALRLAKSSAPNG